MDLRFSTEFADMNICDVAPNGETWGIDDAKLMSPGLANKSLIYNRAGRLDEAQMPPIGTNMVDQQGLLLLEEWINSKTYCN